jgi:hypothetical protein
MDVLQSRKYYNLIFVGFAQNSFQYDRYAICMFILGGVHARIVKK